MAYFVAGLFVLAVGLLFLRWLSETAPKNIKVVLTFLLFLLFLSVSVLFFVTGKFILSIPTLIAAFVAYQRYRMIRRLWEQVRGHGNGAANNNSLTRADAAEILGVDINASEKDIKAAHKKLMKKFHPDQGGNDYQAREINDAKDVLLK